MALSRFLSAVVVAVSFCAAQNINISGVVTDTGGSPLSGAIVSLEKGGLTATTGEGGSFTISGTAVISGPGSSIIPRALSATIRNGVLFVNVKEKSAVSVSTYNLQGKLVNVIRRTIDAGMNAVSLKGNMGAGICLYKIEAGMGECIIKGCSVNRASGGTGVSVQGSSPEVLAKKNEEINDVIGVTKEGYLNYRVNLTESDTDGIEIEMIVCEDSVTDMDGNVYHAVRIGNQVWTVENLRTTKFNDGEDITELQDNSLWGSYPYPAYCCYGNTTNQDTIARFGFLYNWYTINTGKLFPEGWHVPTTAEWDTLQNFLIANGYNWDGTTEGNKIAKSLAARTEWDTFEEPGTIGFDLASNNSTGFSALPGGSRYYDVDYNYMGTIGYWWCADSWDEFKSYYHQLNIYLDFLDRYMSLNSCGYSIRLVKD